MLRIHLLSLFCLIPLATARTQTCELVSDINTRSSGISSSPEGSSEAPGGTERSSLVRCGSYWYFSASTVETGRELWRTDGTANGTQLVRDILPGTGSSSPSALTCCTDAQNRDLLYFVADDGSTGRELWVSDGTENGTRLVRDVWPGSTNSLPNSSSPAHLECLAGRIYFAAIDGVSGMELWTSDGSAAGTTRVADIAPGSASSTPAYLRRNQAGTEIYFAANDGTNGTELWKTNGTSAGTVLVKDLRSGTGGSSPRYLVVVGGRVLFQANDGTVGGELFVSDGTSAGTGVLKDIRPGSSGSFPDLRWSEGARLGGAIFFSANDGSTGSELWRSDGTASGTVRVADLNPGSISSTPARFVPLSSSLLVFEAYRNGSGREVWRTDGTSAGTSMLRDIYPGSSSSSPQEFARAGSRVMFRASNGSTNGREPWVTDGTAAGTALLKDINTSITGASSDPAWCTTISPSLTLFAANDGVNGKELWATDGTGSGTKIFKELEPKRTTDSSRPQGLVRAHGDTLYFSATGPSGTEPYIWTRDKGARILRDIGPGAQGGGGSQFTPCCVNGKGLVFFVASETGVTGPELWVSDGTKSGTRLVKDIRTGSSGSQINQLVACGERVFFTANDGTSGIELWVSDGSNAGTRLVRDIAPGSSSSSPAHLCSHRGRVYFQARDSQSGAELWSSDGTAAGTTLVRDIRPGTSSGAPQYLSSIGSLLYFSASTSGEGRELWKSDGTSAGTALVRDLRPGSSSSNPKEFVSCKGELFFVASAATSGAELFASDGTAAGTRLVADLVPGSGSSAPTNLTCAEDRLFFGAFTPSTGAELFVSDGTSAGTRIVRDILPGVASGWTGDMVAVGRNVFFVAGEVNRTGTSNEPWFSDGTAAGTRQYCNIWPGTTSSSPEQLVLCDGRVFLVARDLLLGEEVFVLPEPGASALPIGAEGTGPNQAWLRSSAPELGGTAVHRWERGLAQHVGLVVLGPKVPPYALGSAWRGCLHVNWTNYLLLGIAATPSGQLAVPIPNSKGLRRLQVHTQVWWVSLASIVPIEASNGVLLSLGG